MGKNYCLNDQVDKISSKVDSKLHPTSSYSVTLLFKTDPLYK